MFFLGQTGALIELLPLMVRRGSAASVTVSPAQPGVGASATVTVDGVNPCGAVGLIYDGGGEQVHPITVLPYAETHIFSTAGTHVVTAIGHGNCDGQVSVTVNAR